MVLSKYDSDRYFAIISDTNQLVIGTIQDIIRSDKNKIIYLTDISDNTGKSFGKAICNICGRYIGEIKLTNNPYIMYDDNTTEVFDLRGNCILIDTFNYNKISNNYVYGKPRKGITNNPKGRNGYGDVYIIIDHDEKRLTNILFNYETTYKNTNYLDIRTSNIIFMEPKHDYKYELSQYDFRSKTDIKFTHGIVKKSHKYDGMQCDGKLILSEVSNGIAYARGRDSMRDRCGFYYLYTVDLRYIESKYTLFNKVRVIGSIPVLHLKNGCSVIFDIGANPIWIDTQDYTRLTGVVEVNENGVQIMLNNDTKISLGEYLYGKGMIKSVNSKYKYDFRRKSIVLNN